MSRSLPKRTRFEIFKRDGFCCQYCGAHPPQVVLEVDHIQPVSGGGTDAPDNLITACFGCNRGKSSISLSATPASLKDKASDVAEKEEQIKGYYDILLQKQVRIEDEVNRVEATFQTFQSDMQLTDSARRSVKHFLEQLDFFVVNEAMQIAGDMWGHSEKLFRYFCGICWNKIKEQK